MSVVELGSSSAEKKLAVQNLPREKLFKRELGSRRHYGYENAQKQASCERNLSGDWTVTAESDQQILQSLKKCDIYEKIISEQARKGTIGISEGAKACRR